MPRHVDVWLNGIGMRDAATIARVRAVSEDIPADEATTAPWSGRHGQTAPILKRRSLKVTITAQLFEVHDLAKRSEALEQLAAWAAPGGILTVSYRPGRRLRVDATKLPSLGRVRDYWQEIPIELTAYAIPWWEDDAQTSHAGTAGTTGTITFGQTGTRETPVNLTVTPSASLANFSATIGGKTIALEGLGLASGATLTIGHTDEDILTIASGGTGLLSKRTAASADDLFAQPGANTLSWTASASCAVTVSTRGRWA